MVTIAYTGPVFTRGDVVRHTDGQGVVTVGRVQRVSVLRGYHDPSVVVGRYLAVEGVEGVLVPSEQCEAVSA